METQEPSRKRPRTDTDDPETSEDESVGIVEIEDVTPVSRDETYYRADGDCVIRVKDVLFKARNCDYVHRYLLVRDSSVFSDMFSMPQEDGASSQAITDENPVILHDDVADFRALCWSIYALPTEYMDQADESKVDIGKLVSLYIIAQKYQFESHEKFARGLLKTHCSDIDKKSARIQEYFVSCSQGRLKALMKIALLTEEATTQSSLKSALQNVWLFRFKQNPHESASFALAVAEALGLRTFMGKLYYYLLTAVGNNRIEGSVVYRHPVDDLTLPQRLVFFQGYWSLQQYWSDLMISPRKKFKCPSSQPSHGCNRVWKDIWLKLKLGSSGYRFDPLDHLKFFLISVTSVNEETFHEKNISCIESYINEVTMELENSLADHFLDPLPSAPPIVEVE